MNLNYSQEFNFLSKGETVMPETMEDFLGLLDRFAGEQKRRMGRPAKIPPFSHYTEYKSSDIEFFISLVEGDEILYDRYETNLYIAEHRNAKFDQIERKCSHFLAMRKGKNGQKLWQTLYIDFEKEYKRRNRPNWENDNQFKFYKNMEFLVDYIENPTKRQLLENFIPQKHEIQYSEDGEEQCSSKRAKLEKPEQDDWFMKVLETVTKSEQNQHETSPPPLISSKSCDTTPIRCDTPTTTNTTTWSSSSTSNVSSKHSDIISCVVGYLDNVPNDQLMLAKVRLFQFLQSEKDRIKNESTAA